MKPITIITGYLGSGKTTLLNNILKQNHGRKIAVIENEFGEKNIDYEFVLHEKEQIYQMTNGCICCNVREDLITTLHEIHLLSEKFDSIIIETTGIADPSPILHTLKQDKILKENYEIDSIVCLIDAKNYLTQIERSPEVKKQLTSSNIVLINKIDLVQPSIVTSIKNSIETLNPEAQVLESKYSEILLNEIFLQYKFKLSEKTPLFLSKVKHDPRVSSQYLEFVGEIDPQYFSIWLDLLFFQCGENLYRMKGVLNFKDDPNRIFFQSIHDYVEFSKGDSWENYPTKESQIVIIGVDLDRKLIESGFKSCVK
jgi:G3E family GTPase